MADDHGRAESQPSEQHALQASVQRLRSADHPLTYLITGGAGFIGSHLADRLLAQGHRVLALDDLSTGSLSNITHLLPHPRFKLARCGIAQSSVLDRLMSEADVVIHLAAAVGVKLIVEQPVHTIETNVMGTEAVLQGALRYGCRVLVASTSEVYGKGSRLPFREEDDVVLGPSCRSRWAYSASKLVDEFLGFAYHREHGLNVTVTRLFNTVGPRQTGRYGMVIPRFVRQALANEPITVYGDGGQSRCFCHVQDVVEGLLGLLEHPDSAGRVFNIGSTEEVTILQLAERIRELTGSQSEIVLVPYEQAYADGFEDMRRRIPSTERIQQLVGWQPKRSLDQILSSVLDHERGAAKPGQVASGPQPSSQLPDSDPAPESQLA